jgi:ABC-2 type transport system permease protein
MSTDRAINVETAPSQLREHEPTISRYMGGAGWGLVVVGLIIVLANRWSETPRFFSEGWGWFFVTVGIVFGLVHAAAEIDTLLRRVLGGVGAALLLVGVGWGLAMAFKERSWAQGLIPGIPGILLISLFLRREEDREVRRLGLLAFVGVGGAILATGLIGAAIQPQMMPVRWIVPMVLGMALLLLGLGQLGPEDDLVYRIVVGIGMAGAAIVILAALRMILPTIAYEWREDPGSLHLAFLAGGLCLVLFGAAGLFVLGQPTEGRSAEAVATARTWGRIGVAAGVLLLFFAVLRFFSPSLLASSSWGLEPPTPYLMPTGLTFVVVGGALALIAVAFCSEHQLVVMTRREFTAYFVSPVAYCVMIGFVLMAAVAYYLFIGKLFLLTLRESGPLEEPIVSYYLIDYPPVITAMAAVPLLTMRLFSEERRMGTLEVLLTAPVSDWMVVISKFLGAWMFFVILWVPWWLFLIAMRLEGGKEFEFRPVLGYMLAVTACGASFTAMGLFFSSLTRDQIVGAALSFMGMMILVGFFFLERFLRPGAEDWTTSLKAVFRALSFIHMWIEAISGKLYLRDVAVQCSIAVFWLFATIKVLEIRRWS